MTLAQVSLFAAFMAGFVFAAVGLSVIFAGILFDIYTYNRRHEEWKKKESERLDKEADKND